MYLNRRKLVAGMMGMGAYLTNQARDVTVGYGLGWGVDEIFNSLVGETPFQYEERAKDIARNIFFGTGDNFAVFPAFNNPLTHNERFNGQRVTKPTAYASQCLQALLPQNSVIPQEEIRLNDITNKWIVVLGSPESNLLTRLLFGGSEEHFDARHLHDKSDLTFPFQFSRAIYNNGEPIFRRRGPNDGGVQINALLELTSRGYKQLVPSLQKHVLQEDFAILTSIPSFQSEDDYVEGRRIVNFCGLHGFGTQSLNTILKSQTLLEELKKKSEGFEAWQAMIRVSELDHSSNIANFVWTEPDVRPIEGNFRGIAQRFARSGS